MDSAETSSFQIWVDADACPAAIKEIIYRTARRLQLQVTLVANQSMYVPRSKRIRLITVPEGADVADDRIVEMLAPGDVVITGDIPLAARVVDKSAIAIGVRGELLDENSVHDRLASRDLMEQFRSAGVDTRGPSPLTQKDIQAFANQLDRTLTRRLKQS
ncbi:YaiI/YqxD family protein [Aeoliella sp. SH292]|uniref:YaiI/YqxD family protein n=1 Tax=Aeoliella sp. SH292 TaxID=3454464 RepID=UPI003F966C92